MTTTYYIAYETKKSNGVKVWYETKHYDNADQANDFFQKKVKDGRTTEAHLWKCDVWTDPTEIPFDTTTNRQPGGWYRKNPIASYNPQFFSGVKIWDIE